jgi:hypothetical protein
VIGQCGLPLPEGGGALERSRLCDQIANGGESDVVARSVCISLPHQRELLRVWIR